MISLNDEIKEILDNIKEDINGKFEWEYVDGYYVEQIKPLLDYITNLQQKNEKLKELCDKYEEEHSNEFKIWKEERHELLDYKSRCEKASEIIKKEKEIMGYAKYDSCLLLIENILQNGDDKNV